MKLLQTLKQGFHNWYYDVQSVEPEDVPEPPEPDEVPLLLPVAPKGRVIATKHVEYSPQTTRTGGRVTKIMPKQLKQMKQAQEKLGDD